MTTPSPLHPDLQRLLDGLIDDTLLPAERTALAAMLQTDAAARRLYCSYFGLHLLLQAELCLPLKTPAFANMLPTRRTPVVTFLTELTSAAKRTATRYARPVTWAVVVSNICLLAYVGVLFRGMFDRHKTQYSAVETQAEQVATITASEDAQWLTDDAAAPHQKSEITNHKSEILPGKSLAIASGIIELQLKQGVRMAIEGPAEWSIDGANAATLMRGKLVAMVPRRAIGFTIATPTATVVDLGTEFGVVVNESAHTDVQVLTGKVEVHTPIAPTHLVHADEAVRVQGQSVQAIAVDRNKFAALRFKPPQAVAAPAEVLAAPGRRKSWNNPDSWSDHLPPTPDKRYRMGSNGWVQIRSSEHHASEPFTGGSLTIDREAILMLTHYGTARIRDLRLDGGKLVMAKFQAGGGRVTLSGRIQVLRPSRIELWNGSMKLAATLEGSDGLTVVGPGKLQLSTTGRHYEGAWQIQAQARVTADTITAFGSGDVTLSEESQLIVRYDWDAPAATLRIGDGCRFQFTRRCQLGRLVVNEMELPRGEYTATELAKRFPANFVEGEAVLRVGLPETPLSIR